MTESALARQFDDAVWTQSKGRRASAGGSGPDDEDEDEDDDDDGAVFIEQVCLPLLLTLSFARTLALAVCPLG